MNERITGMSESEARCPYCLEDRLVERDHIMQRFVCLVCSKTWPFEENHRPRGGKSVVSVTDAATRPPVRISGPS